MNNKSMAIFGGIIGLVVITAGLIYIAQGTNYELTVTDPQIGPDSAPIVLEEFSDFQCPACAAAAPLVKEALSNFPDQVKFIYKDFPLSSIHPQARTAAAGALCAAQQDQFQSFHDALFANQSSWSAADGDVMAFMSDLVDEFELNRADWETCVDSRDARKAVDANFAEGRNKGVNSTPTFFLDGKQIQPPQSVFQWIQLIEDTLEEKGITQVDSDSMMEETAG